MHTLNLLRLGENLLLTLLTTSTKTQYQMQGRLLLNIVIAQSTSVLQLLSSKDQTLLIGWDSLLVLNLSLDIIDRVRWLNIERDGLTCYIIFIIMMMNNNIIIAIGNALRDASQTWNIRCDKSESRWEIPHWYVMTTRKHSDVDGWNDPFMCRNEVAVVHHTNSSNSNELL